MKILKRGIPDAEKQYRVTCYKCKTFFEFLYSEAAFSSDQRDGDCLYINCPVCSTVAGVSPLAFINKRED
jgi:RNase P subunit RPR2